MARRRTTTSTPTTPPVAPVTPPVAEPVTPDKPKRVTTPRTCGNFVALHADDPKFALKVAGRDATCKRLPMHHGECRPTLKVVVAKTPKASVKVTPAKTPRITKQTLLDAAAALAAGTMTPTAYMSLVSAFGQRRTRKALSNVVATA